jgi:hypothetical protein
MLAASLVAAFGCSTRSTVITSAPPPSAKLSQLERPEAAQLCDSVEARARAQVGDSSFEHASCLLVAGFAAQFSDATDSDFDPHSACEQTYAKCTAAKPRPAADTDAGVGLTLCSPKHFSGCKATVATFRKCQETSLDAIVNAPARLTCSDIVSARDAGVPDDPIDTPSCRALYERCPGLAETPPSTQQCSASVRASGAIEADLTLPSDNCSSHAGRTLEGVDWIALSVWTSGDLALNGIELTLAKQRAPFSKSLDGIGLAVWSSHGSVRWLTEDGCTGDVEVESCKFEGASGVRYRIRHGRCPYALPADVGSARELTVAEFSFMSYCVLN